MCHTWSLGNKDGLASKETGRHTARRDKADTMAEQAQQDTGESDKSQKGEEIESSNKNSKLRPKMEGSNNGSKTVKS